MSEDRIYGIHPVREALLGKGNLKILLRQGMDSNTAAQMMDLAKNLTCRSSSYHRRN